MQCILNHIIHAKGENIKLKYESRVTQKTLRNLRNVKIMKAEQVCV